MLVWVNQSANTFENVKAYKFIHYNNNDKRFAILPYMYHLAQKLEDMPFKNERLRNACEFLPGFCI